VRSRCAKYREHNASSYDCGFHSEILRTSFNDQSANKREWDPLAGRDAAEHTPVIRVDCTWGSSHPYRDSRESGQHLPLHTLGISYPLYARVRDQRKPVMSAIQEHLHSIAVSSLPSPQKYTQHLLSGTPAFHDHAHVGVRSHAGATSNQSPSLTEFTIVVITNASDTKCIFRQGQQRLVYLRQIFVRRSQGPHQAFAWSH